MADYRSLPNFILPSEGGLSNNANDAGGLTNKGITFAVWITYFGDTLDRFKAMTPADWMVIFKGEYWDKALGDDINNQRVANFIVDWIFNGGKYYPEKHVQTLINEITKNHIIDVDGNFGPKTIEALNCEDQDLLYKNLIADRLQYYTNLCAQDLINIKALNPTVTDPNELAILATKAGMKMLPNLTGWKNRVANLIKFNEQFI